MLAPPLPAHVRLLCVSASLTDDFSWVAFGQGLCFKLAFVRFKQLSSGLSAAKVGLPIGRGLRRSRAPLLRELRQAPRHP